MRDILKHIRGMGIETLDIRMDGTVESIKIDESIEKGKIIAVTQQAHQSQEENQNPT
jgi:hypothetical protein